MILKAPEKLQVSPLIGKVGPCPRPSPASLIGAVEPGERTEIRASRIGYGLDALCYGQVLFMVGKPSHWYEIERAPECRKFVQVAEAAGQVPDRAVVRGIVGDPKSIRLNSNHHYN